MPEISFKPRNTVCIGDDDEADSSQESITVHAGPSVTIDTVAAQTSIVQTIAQAFGDNTVPPEPGSSGSLLSSPIHGAPLGTPHAELTAETHRSALTFTSDSVDSQFAQHSAAGAPGSHGTQVMLQDVLHAISFSELGQNLPSALHSALTSHALGLAATTIGSIRPTI